MLCTNLSKIVDREHFSSPLILYGSSKDHLEKTALELANSVLSLQGNDATQAKLAKGYHPDLYQLAPEGKGKVFSMESIRKVISDTLLPPYEAKYRVTIFHQAEKMLPVHANALLKTLEEKPSFSMIILTTTEVKEILPTIASRSFMVAVQEKEELSKLQDVRNLVPTAMKAAISREYSILFATIEKMEQDHEEILDVVIDASWNWIGDLLKVQRGKHQSLAYPSEERDYFLHKDKVSFSYDFLEKVSKQARLGLSCHIKLKTILEFFFLKVTSSN